MRPKSILLLVLALGCGLVASIGISQVMERRGAGGQEGERVEVLVAKVEIGSGEEIKADMVAVQAVPRELVAEDTLTKIEDVEGKRPNAKLLVGEIIREGKLGEAKAAPIPKGFRVVTIRATADRGGNLLKPGDRVDVQVYVRANAVPQINEPTLQTFLQDVRVYAVDTKTTATEEDQGSATTRTVSLLVTPDQSGKLTYASQIGQIQLVMRGTSDADTATVMEPVSWEKLVNTSETPGDRKDKNDKSSDVLSPTEGGLSIEEEVRRRLANMMSSQPPKDQFVMLAVRGDQLVQYTFGDPAKPPVGWGALDGGSADSSPAPEMPEYAPPADEADSPAPQPRISPLRPARNSPPIERYAPIE